MGAASPMVFSILGDIYDEKERPTASAILTTSFGLGSIAGPVLGGFVGQAAGWRLPFFLAAGAQRPPAPGLLVPGARAPGRGKRGGYPELVEAGILYPKHIRVKDYARLGKVPTNVYLFIQGIVGTIPLGGLLLPEQVPGNRQGSLDRAGHGGLHGLRGRNGGREPGGGKARGVGVPPLRQGPSSSAGSPPSWAAWAPWGW
ncbi:MAG: MFS transporter [Desulfomicrobium escambiense]|nr:MFS transporter [Desulfomicrobium escambiense]